MAEIGPAIKTASRVLQRLRKSYKVRSFSPSSISTDFRLYFLCVWPFSFFFTAPYVFALYCNCRHLKRL